MSEEGKQPATYLVKKSDRFRERNGSQMLSSMWQECSINLWRLMLKQLNI